MRLKGVAMAAVSNGVSLIRAPLGARNGLRVLIYHSVGASVYGDVTGLNSVNFKQFRDHVDILKKFKAVPFSPVQLVGDGLSIALTFDDGYADNLHIAAPILQDAGIPFTVFVSTDFIEKGVPGFLKPKELKELAGCPGVTIGSHGRSHVGLTTCDDSKLKNELQGSKGYLEDLLGVEVGFISYPYGMADRRVLDAAMTAGYTVGGCSHFDVNREGRNPMMLNRCVVLSEDCGRVVKQKIQGDWDWYRWRHQDPLLL